MKDSRSPTAAAADQWGPAGASLFNFGFGCVLLPRACHRATARVVASRAITCTARTRGTCTFDRWRHATYCWCSVERAHAQKEHGSEVADSFLGHCVYSFLLLTLQSGFPPSPRSCLDKCHAPRKSFVGAQS